MGEKFTAKNRVTFTQNRVAALPCQGGDRTYYYDTKAPGLCLCVTAAGGRTFYRLGREKGRTVRVLLGKFPALTVDDARRQALAVASDTAKGYDPQAAKLAKRHEQTIGGLFQWWLEWAKDHKRSWQGDEWLYNAYLKAWGGRKLSAIRQADVAAHHAKIGRDHGRYSANRMLALLRAMYNRASNIGWKGDNPARGVQRFKEESRERFLQADELPRFFAALAAEPNADFRDALLTMLLTGARRGNVLAMRWQDIDLERGLWSIPGAKAKAGMTIVLPLAAPVVTLLAGRRHAANGCPWVFPSHGKSGHLADPKAAWQRVLARAGLQDVRIHDLRRTLGSWQAMQGASLQVIGKSLGHQQITTTMIYSRLTVDPVRASVDKATTAMLAAGEKKPQNGQAGQQDAKGERQEAIDVEAKDA